MYCSFIFQGVSDNLQIVNFPAKVKCVELGCKVGELSSSKTHSSVTKTTTSPPTIAASQETTSSMDNSLSTATQGQMSSHIMSTGAKLTDYSGSQIYDISKKCSTENSGVVTGLGSQAMSSQNTTGGFDVVLDLSGNNSFSDKILDLSGSNSFNDKINELYCKAGLSGTKRKTPLSRFSGINTLSSGSPKSGSKRNLFGFVESKKDRLGINAEMGKLETGEDLDKSGISVDLTLEADDSSNEEDESIHSTSVCESPAGSCEILCTPQKVVSDEDSMHSIHSPFTSYTPPVATPPPDTPTKSAVEIMARIAQIITPKKRSDTGKSPFKTPSKSPFKTPKKTPPPHSNGSTFKTPKKNISHVIIG